MSELEEQCDIALEVYFTTLWAEEHRPCRLVRGDIDIAINTIDERWLWLDAVQAVVKR